MMKDPCRWKLHKVPEVESHSEYLSSVLTWKKVFIISDGSEPPSWAKLTVRSIEKSKIQLASVRKHQRIEVFHQVRLRHQTFSNFFRDISPHFKRSPTFYINMIFWLVMFHSLNFRVIQIKVNCLGYKISKPSKTVRFMASKIADPVDMSNTENSCSNKPW